MRIFKETSQLKKIQQLRGRKIASKRLLERDCGKTR
jgi:hypothetical protein